MTSFINKRLLIVECIISWVEIVAVLTIDSNIMRITINGTSKASLHFFTEAVMCMLGIYQKEELIVFLSLHLAAHAVWLIALLVMVAGMFLSQPPSAFGISLFFINAFVVSLVDLASTIYFGVETSKVYADCPQSLFFPLYFCKGILLWIANLVAAVHMLTLQRHSRNGEIKESRLSRSETVYSIPWESHTDLMIPPPVGLTPEVPQPRSIMKNPNNPNYQTRQASVKFRGSTSTESTTDSKDETDFTMEAFRSAVRYPDITADYMYWDSFVHKSKKPSNDNL